MSDDSISIDKRKVLGSVLGSIIAFAIAVMIVSTMFPVFELTSAVTSSGSSFQECECENVSVDSEMANAQEVKQNIFDIEQVDQSVIRVLVSVPDNVEHRYLVMEVTYLTEDGRTIESHREMVEVGTDKVQILEIKQDDKMEFSPRVKVEPVGWSDNRFDRGYY